MKNRFGILNLLFAFTLLTPLTSYAEYTWDSGFFYLSDAFKYTSDSSNSMMVYNTSFNFEIGHSHIFAGWDLLGFSQSEDPGTGQTKTFSSTEMGPRFMWANKQYTVEAALSYHLRNTTTYSPGTGTTATIKGNAIYFELAYMPEWTDHINAGIKLNYYTQPFTESLTNNTNYTQVSYNKTAMFPSLAICVHW